MRPATHVFYGFFAGLLFTINPSMSFAGNVDGSVLANTAGEQFATLSITLPGTSTDTITVGLLAIKPKSYSASITNSTTLHPASVAGIIKPEPSIDYHLVATNNSLSDEFLKLAIGTYIVPQGMYVEFQNNLSVTTSGSGPISLTPTYDGVNPSAGFQRELFSTDGGLSFNMADEYGPLGTTITTAGTTVFPTYDLTDYKTPNYDYMELLVGFNLSSGATVTLDGSITINAVPEPSTLMMAFIAAIMLVGFNVQSRIKPRFKLQRN